MHEALERCWRRAAFISTRCGLRFPVPDSVPEFIASARRVFVVEQNRDAQMRAMLVNELEINRRNWSRCCTTTARRSPALHHPRHSRHIANRRLPTAPRRRPHDLDCQTQLHHPTLTKNKVGYTRRDYEGRISTL